VSTNGIGSFCAVRHSRSKGVDTESHLRGLDHLLDNWKPPDNIVKDINPEVQDVTKTTPVLKISEPMSTRTSKSCIGNEHIYRFEDLTANPQSINHIVITENERGGVNTRNQAKDGFKCKFRN
jgi:hypothetical protein